MSQSQQWNTWVRSLKCEVHALYLACKVPRTPWYAKLVAATVAAYALSPIDLIPDPIPILGYLDDLLLLPLGIWLSIKLIPTDVMDDCRRQAKHAETVAPTNWWVAAIIIAIWLLALATIVYVFTLILYRSESVE